MEIITARKVIPFFIIALSLTIFSGYFSILIGDIYYTHHPFTPDPSTNLEHSIELHHSLQSNNKLSLLVNEFHENRKNALMTIPLIVFAPQLLANKYGHLLLLLPAICLFLFLLGRLTYNLSGNILLSVAIMVSFITTLVLYAPYFGSAFYLPDCFAPYAIGISAIALINWHRTNSFYWFCCFVIFCCLAVMSRYISVVYVIVIFLPLLIIMFYNQFRNSRKLFEKFNYPLALITTALAIISFYYLLIHLKSNYQYYSHWQGLSNVTMNFPISFSMISFVRNYAGFFGLTHLILIGCLISFLFINYLKVRPKNKLALLIRCWYLISLPLYWIIVLKINADRVSPIILNYLPITFVAFAPWFSLRSFSKPLINISIIVFIFLCSLSFLRSYNKCARLAEATSQYDYQMKSVQQAGANIIAGINKPLVITDLVNNGFVSTSVRLESYYRDKKYIGALNFRPFNPAYAIEPFSHEEKLRDITSQSNFVIISNRLEETDWANTTNSNLMKGTLSVLQNNWELVDKLIFPNREIYFFLKP